MKKIPNKLLKNKSIIQVKPKFNLGIAKTYHNDIKILLKKHFQDITDDIINKFLETQDIKVLQIDYILRNSGFYENKYIPEVKQIANNFITKIDNLVNANLRSNFNSAKQSIPMELIQNSIDDNSKNIIKLQINKITNLMDQQYSNIYESVTQNIVQGGSLTKLKSDLKESGIYDDKRIDTISKNQLFYATNVVNINKAQNFGLKQGIWKHPPESVYKTHGRPSHIKADGTVFDLAKGCKIDEEYIFPGQLPNCKCSFIYNI